MKTKPMNAYWASELAPNEPIDTRLDSHVRSTDVATLDAAVSDQQATELEQYRRAIFPKRSMRYTYQPTEPESTVQLAEMVDMLTRCGFSESITH